MFQEANQRVTQMLERLSGACYLTAPFSVHFTSSTCALSLAFPLLPFAKSLLAHQHVFCWDVRVCRKEDLLNLSQWNDFKFCLETNMNV